MPPRPSTRSMTYRSVRASARRSGTAALGESRPLRFIVSSGQARSHKHTAHGRSMSIVCRAAAEGYSCPMLPASVQRRTLSVLFLTQIVGGTGSALGGAVAALLAAELGGVGISGLAQSASVVG